MTELKPDQLLELAEDLRELAVELRALVDGSADGAKPVDLDEPIGRLSRMDAMQQQSMTRATREAARARLKQVEAALTRIDEATKQTATASMETDFGCCVECEEPIGFDRLKARPEARLCIACQTDREKPR